MVAMAQSRSSGASPVQIARLDEFIDQLQAQPQGATAIFTTPDGEIGRGYHLTEIKRAAIEALDCGGRTDRWTEVVLQLLDGDVGRPMTVGTLKGILERGRHTLEGLDGARLQVEFAHANQGLSRHTIAGIASDPGQTTIALQPERAACKPIAEVLAGAGAERCCTPSSGGCRG